MNTKQRGLIGAMILIVIAFLFLLGQSLSMLNVNDDAYVLFGVISIIILVIFTPTLLIWLWKKTFNINKTPKIGE